MIEPSPIRIAFFGSSDLSVFVLEALKAAGFLPGLIVTAPDMPKGRKLVLTPPVTKVWADQNGIAVTQPASLKDPAFLEQLRAGKFDVSIVASYGKLIPKSVLDAPARGTLNVHPSLLPKLRGASPIQSAILDDERDTGVTIIQLDEQMDHGPIVGQEKAEIPASAWPPRREELQRMLGTQGGALLARLLPGWVAGEIAPKPQDHAAATFCKKISKEDGLLDLSAAADADPAANYKNFLKIRAYSGWPGTYFFAEKDGRKIRVIIKDARLENGTLLIARVIPEGKKEMDYAAFARSIAPKAEEK